jgi:hypothetical protein
MIEGYTTEEVIECCIDYMKDGNPINVLVSRHHGRLSGKGTKGHKSFIDVTYQRVCVAHFSIMQQLSVMRPYIEKHLQELRERIQDPYERHMDAFSCSRSRAQGEHGGRLPSLAKESEDPELQGKKERTSPSPTRDQEL